MKWKKVGMGLFVIFIITLSGYLIYKFTHTNVLGIVSPLSPDYTYNEAQYRVIFDKKTTQNYPPNAYFPKLLFPKYIDDIGVNAKAYAVMDRKSGELLLSKNLTQELPIASVAKIMTAIISLEHADLDVELNVSSAAASVGEAEMGLTVGEKVRVEDLLYGLMLPSGNDAAETLAEGLQNGRTSFIISMNDKAQSLGLFDTYFFNPTGLDGKTLKLTSFSTPLDLLALTNYALQNQEFAKIVSTSYKEIPYQEGKHKAFYLDNILQLNRSYPGIKGVKPGETDFAGETLVSYAENGDHQIIVVLLGTKNSRDEAVKIYDFIFPKIGVKINGRS